MESAQDSTLVKNLQNIENQLNQDTTVLAPVKKLAFQRFRALGVPTSRDENWKYTNLQTLARSALTPVSKTPTQSMITQQEVDAQRIPGVECHTLVFINGQFHAPLSAIHPEIKAFTLDSLASSLEPAKQTANRIEIIQQHLTKHACYEEQAFVALNTSLLNDGTLLVVPKNTTVEKPILLLHFTTSSQEAIIPVRNLIVAEEGSEVKIVEKYLGESKQASLTSTVTELVCKTRAKVEHTKVQLESSSSYHVSTLEVRQEASSHFTSNVFSFGGKVVRNEINPILDGENIESLLNGLTVLSGEQHVDNHTVIDHAKPNCFSRELYKGIYAEKSHGVFSGTIIVREDAQKTNAIQSNQTLLLSEDASIDSQPQLKIWADDVKCTHGATVGQIDKDALFYLRSRGVSKNDARNMLIRAFASDIVTHVSIPELRTQLEEELSRRLPQS